MLIFTVLIYIFLIFPIFLNLDVFYCLELKKLYFSIRIFGASVLSGYAEQITEGFAIHLTKNYAIIITYKSFFKLRRRVKPLKDYHFKNFNLLVDLGNEEDLLLTTSTAFFVNYACNHLQNFIKNNKPYVKFFNKINVYENKNLFNISIRILVLFNLLMLILSLIKIGVEKIINVFRSKKRPHKQRG